MNIYFIAPKDIFSKKYITNIANLGKVIYLSSDNIQNYKILKEDNEEKIVIYDPDYAGWNFPNDILNNVINLKAIFLGTTDTSYVDMNVCTKNNIEVINIPKYASESVAEYLIMYMFALSKKLPLQLKNNNSQVFDEQFMQMELKNKNVGIVGLGNIGLRVAEICSGIGMNIYYWNRTKKENNYNYIELKELFKECDVIFICLSINEETKNLISDDLLNSMSKQAILISGAGKQLFNSKLVEQKVKNNEIFGFAFEEPDTELNNYDGNVMVTSEYGWFTKEASELRLEKWATLVINYLNERNF